MAAVPQQGAYLATTIIGFTALFAGFAGLGIVVALVGLVLLVISAAGFFKVKSQER